MRVKAECQTIIFLLCLLKVVEITAQCVRPELGANMVVDPYESSYSDGSKATVRCSTGYKTPGPPPTRSITCNGNKWTSFELQCQKKSCGALPDIHNGVYTYNPEGDDGILFGATATATCNQGYKIVGSPSRRCLNDGWDGRNPECEVVKCLPPPAVENGYPNLPFEESYEYGQAVEFSCDKGYTPFGNKIISCSEDGTFQPSPLQCKKVSCEQPDVKNGRRIEGRPPYVYRSFVNYKCNDGFRMEGSGYLVCEENGWNPPPPQCIALDVPTPRTTTRSTRPTSKAHEVTPRTTTRSTRPTSKAQVTTPRTTTSSTRTTSKDDREIIPTPTPPPNHGWKIGVGVCVGAVCASVLGYFVYKYKKRSSTEGYSAKVATKSEEGEF